MDRGCDPEVPAKIRTDVFDIAAPKPKRMRRGCPQQRGQPLGRRPVGLFGQDDLSAEAFVLSAQGAEVDTASAGAAFGILPVPRQVVVAGLLLAVGWRLHELARGVVEPNPSGTLPYFSLSMPGLPRFCMLKTRSRRDSNTDRNSVLPKGRPVAVTRRISAAFSAGSSRR